MVEFMALIYGCPWVVVLSEMSFGAAFGIGFVHSICFLFIVSVWWETWGRNTRDEIAHKIAIRKTKPIPATPPCYRCEDTGFAPNPNHIGGLPVLCFCPVGQKMDNRIHNARDYKPRKPACTSCGDTGFLSLSGVKTVPCGCIRGNFYRTLAEVRCLK